MNVQNGQHKSRITFQMKNSFGTVLKNSENFKKLPESNMQRILLIKLTSDDSCYIKTGWWSKEREEKCMEDGNSVHRRERFLTETERGWKVWSFWEFERFREFESVKLSLRRAVLFIDFLHARIQRLRSEGSLWSNG